MLKENREILKSIPGETQDGDTRSVPWSSVSTNFTVENSAEPFFEQDLTEALLEQIPAFVDEVNMNHMVKLLQSVVKEDSFAEINDSTDQKERAFKLISYFRRLGDKHHAYKVFTSLIACAYPLMFRSAAKRMPTKVEIEYYPTTFQKVLKEKLKQMKMNDVDDEGGKDNMNTDKLPYIKLQIIKRNLPSASGIHNQDKNGLGVNNLVELDGPEEEINLTEFIKRDDTPLPKGKKLLVKGRGGVGKTMTMEYLSNLWLSGKWNPDYTLVLLVNLRKWIDSKYEKGISAMNILADNIVLGEVQGYFISRWLMNWSRHVLFLMDGIDEIEHWTSNLKPSVEITDIDRPSTPLDIFLNILHGTLLPEATVLYTSREFKGLENIRCDGLAEIRGFGDEGVESFVKEVYRNKPDDGRKIKKTLKKHYIPRSMCSLPFHCKEICDIVEENSALLTDEIDTRTRLTALIITRHLSRTIQSYGSKSETLEEKMSSPYLLKLAELAFSGLFHMKKSSDVPKVVFNKNDIREAKMSVGDVEQAVTDGLLISLQDDDSSQTGPLQFSHHTFQEILAMALFIGRHGHNSTKRKMVFGEIASVSDDRFTMAKRFMYGLAYDLENPVVVKMKEAFADHDQTDRHEEALQEKKLYRALQQTLKDTCKKAKDQHNNHLLLEVAAIAHECKDVAIAREVNKGLFTKNEHLALADVHIESVDMLALVSVIKQPIAMRTISIKNTHLDASALKVLSQFLAANNTVEELSLCGTGTEGFESLNSMLTTNKSIKNLILERNGLTDTHLRTLNSGLSALKNLRSLSLRFNKVTEDGLAILAQSLGKQVQLTELLLDSNDITDEAKKAINKCLANKSKLRVFSLRKNTLSDDSCVDIADIIKRCKELERVDLSQNQFGTAGAKRLIKELRRKTQLDLSVNQIAVRELGDPKNVRLLGNAFGKRRVQIVTQSIKDGSTFKILNLEGINLTDERFSTVAEGLIGNAKLAELKLANNSLTRRSLKSINQLAFTCPSLRRIDVSKNHMEKTVIESLRDIYSYTRKGLSELPITDERKLTKAKKTIEIAPKLVDKTLGAGISLDITKMDSMRLTVLDLTDAKLTKDHVEHLTSSLETNVGLRKMELANCGLSTSDVGSICQLLCRGTRLLHLGLASNNLKDDSVYYMIQVLERNSNLLSLNLSSNFIGAIGIDLLFEASEKNEKLESLNLSRNMIDAEHHLDFGKAMRKGRTLKNLNLGSCCDDGRTTSHLVNLLRNKSLLTFDMSNNRIGEQIARNLGEALKYNETLEVLDLSENKLGSRGIEALRHGLCGNKSLVSLKLRKNCLGESGATALGHIIFNMNIVHLDIAENGIGSRGMEALVPDLQQNQSIRSLNLRNNMIGADGAKHLETALKGNTVLTSLNLSSNLMLAKGAKSVARMVKTTNITHLDLADNAITDQGVYYLVEAMLEHTVLVELTLTKNNIHEAGVREIERGLRNNKSLKTLDLSENWVNDDASEWIARIIMGNGSLTSLNLSDNSIENGGATTLIRALRSGSSLLTLDWTKNTGITDKANEELHKAFFDSKV